MSRSLWRRRVPPRVAVAVAGLIALSGLVGGGVVLHRMNGPTPPREKRPAIGVDVLPEGSYPTGPLAAGTPCPPFEAAGWINGPPPRPGRGAARLIVLDLWADW